MSAAESEVKVEKSEIVCTDTITTTTTTTATTATTTTTTTTTATTTATTATTATTTTATTATTGSTTDTTTSITTAVSGMEEEKKDIAENLIPSCTTSKNLENTQFRSNFAVTSTTMLTTPEKSSLIATEEKTDLIQSSNSSNTVANDDAIADKENTDRSEFGTFETENTTAAVTTTNEVSYLQNSGNSSDQKNKTDCNVSDSAEHNLKIISDQTLKPEVTTPGTFSALFENQTKAVIVEHSDAAFKPSDGKKEENDLKDERVKETDKGTEKENSGSEGDYKTKEGSTSLDDKEVSSDDADHFVDAKSSTQIDGTSEDDAVEIGEETKEQPEEIQDEEGYDYDEEEQEAEPDDDEVEDNPAFIPKSGRYYMHDSRNTDEERTSEPSSHSRADGKWKHDRFDERSQRPKTKRELMNRYGYDIRNEGKNTGGGSMNASTPHFNQNRGTSRPNYGNRGRHSNRTPLHHPQHQPDDRRDRKRAIQNSGTGRPANRGGRKSEHHVNINHQRDQHGTRVFKNSPMHTQKGATNRTDNHRTYDRSEEHLRDKRQNTETNKGRGGGIAVSGGDASAMHGKSGGSHTGGKRYSTQRLATNYAPNVQQLPPPQPPPPLQPARTTGPIPIPPPDWHPPAYRGPPPPPPAIAIPAPVPNFRPSDIVYFDPQPQQLFRSNPIPPRTKKRLEIVPPYQAKNSN
ncbi:CASC3/Barentsz eIF4AIII binding family protein [Acanthocheilonema viteae]